MRLLQDGAAKIRFPAHDGDPLEAILINTAGGLTGGDRVAWDVEAEHGSSIALTTQACEKVYRAGGGRAEIDCRLVAHPGARIAWLPQETIVFDRSCLRRRIEVDAGAGAEVLIVESTILGRKAMGETVGIAEFHDRWRVRQEGRLVHAEDFRLGPNVGALVDKATVANGSTALATVLLVSPAAEDRLDAARTIVGPDGGVSFWRVGGTGKLLARLVGRDGYALRSRLIPLVELLNGKAGLPKTWSL